MEMAQGNFAASVFLKTVCCCCGIFPPIPLVWHCFTFAHAHCTQYKYTYRHPYSYIVPHSCMCTQVLFHNQYLGMHGVFVWFSSLDFPHVIALKQRSTAYMLIEALIYLYIKALFGTLVRIYICTVGLQLLFSLFLKISLNEDSMFLTGKTVSN